VLTVVLTRHGSTPRSDPEQHLGQGIDIGLSPEGEAAARGLAMRLEGVAFDRIVSSPLRRAVQTGEIVAAGRAVETDPRVAEMDYGEWEGLTYAQIEARDVERRRRWEADPATEHCPGGESGNEVAARVRSFLVDAIERARSSAHEPEAEGRILVVAHATLNRILLCVALGVRVRDFRRRFRQDPANLTILRFPSGVDAGALLVLANDTAHLGMTPPGIRER
jgi:broad specificity phosphatase PhoE